MLIYFIMMQTLSHKLIFSTLQSSEIFYHFFFSSDSIAFIFKTLDLASFGCLRAVIVSMFASNVCFQCFATLQVITINGLRSTNYIFITFEINIVSLTLLRVIIIIVKQTQSQRSIGLDCPPSSFILRLNTPKNMVDIETNSMALLMGNYAQPLPPA